MIIQIDQSIKIEDTARHTVIADSLGNHICISSKTKQALQHYFRIKNKPRLFVIETFSFLLAYLISEHYKKEHTYVIDIEYPGHENGIKAQMFRYFSRLNSTISANQVRFDFVGKKSVSHTTAYLIATKGRKNKNMLSLAKVLSFLP